MKTRRRLLLFFCILGVVLGTAAVPASAKNRRTVRVGCPSQKGLTFRTEDGKYEGYTIDYLEEISKYTDWTCEYVEVEGDLNTQILTLMEMLQKGEIDLLGAMNYSEALAEEFFYPSYNYGTSYTALTVSKSSVKWMEEDYKNWNGIRIASYPGMEKRMQLLDAFARVNGFTYEVVECSDAKEMFQSVYDGEADAILQVDISMAEGFRSIARFNPQNFYFAVSKEKPELFKELNQGLYSLVQSYPDLQTELYEKYFSHKGDFYLTEESKKYIESLGTLKVLFFEGNKPMQDGKGGKAVGLAAGLFEKLARDLGLQYEEVIAKNYVEGRELIREGKIDLVAAVPPGARLQEEVRLSMTHSYFESYGIAVSNGEIDDEDIGMLNLSANVEKDLKRMARHKGSRVSMDANCISFYIRKKGLYESLSFDWGTTMSIRYSIGIAKGGDNRLRNVINSYINSMPRDSIQQMVYENSYEPVEYSFSELIYVYWERILIVVIGILVSVSLYLGYRKRRELRQKALESDKIYQFSRMTNECLFEYDFRRDQLNVQNSQLFFPDENILNNFLKAFESSFEKFDKIEQKEIGRTLHEMLSGRQEQRDVWCRKEDGDCWYRIQIRYIGKEGESAIGRISDISQTMMEQNALKRRAESDSLTGIHNRAAAERYIDDFLRVKGNEGIMILFDIDNFKTVNDTLGHLAGDQLIQEFAERLKKSFRHTDFMARLGGDEFVVFLTKAIEEEKLAAKLQAVIDDMNQKVFAAYPSCALSASIGAAYSGEQSNDYKSLYRFADNAMYVAKFGGKNDFFIAEDEVCMKRGCDNCRPVCRRREYLLGKGVLRRDEKNPGKFIVVDPHNNGGRRGESLQ
ncbi:MAG: diguanylate cyclase [Eubacteriales bacterium]|nr:diguanylate cyclase [Eubacteriales bacterium]